VTASRESRELGSALYRSTAQVRWERLLPVMGWLQRAWGAQLPLPQTAPGSTCGSINACATVCEGGGRWLPRAGRTARWGLLREERQGSTSGSSKTIYRSLSGKVRTWRCARASRGLRTSARRHELLGAREAEAAALASCTRAGILLGQGGQVLVLYNNRCDAWFYM
jgi:hypothetical protein